MQKEIRKQILESGEKMRTSFSDKLANTLYFNKLIEDFEVKDKDVLFKTEDGVLMISFSDRVQNYISRSMKNCAIIQLLRIAISYYALLGHLQSL